MGAGIARIGTIAKDKGGWWNTRICVVLTILAACMPLIYPPIPPLVDLLGHMGRFAVALDLGRSPWLPTYYDYHWAPIGNLGVDLLVRALAPLLGIEAATKAVVLAIPPLTVAGFLWVAREGHGRIEPTAYFAVPFAYGQPFLYGFVNFALSMALAFLAFALWLRLGRLGRWRLRAVLFVPISLIVFFAHAIGWGVLGLMCLSAEVVRQHGRGGVGWARAGLHAVVQVSSMVAPLAIMLLWRGHSHGPWAWAWFEWHAKLVWIESALRDRWAWFDVACLAIILLLLVLAVRDRRFAFAPVLTVPVLALVVIFLLLPTTLFGSAYTDMRLVPYIFALALLAIRFLPESGRQASVVAAMALAFGAVRLGANTISFGWAAQDQQAKVGALAQIPAGSRVVTFAGIECGGGWQLPRNIHLGSLVTIWRQGFSNDQWLIEGAFGLELKYRQAGDFIADPSQLVLPNGCNDGIHRTIDQAISALPRDAFDYVWLIDPPRYDRKVAHGLRLVWKGPGTELYRVRSGASTVRTSR